MLGKFPIFPQFIKTALLVRISARQDLGKGGSRQGWISARQDLCKVYTVGSRQGWILTVKTDHKDFILVTQLTHFHINRPYRHHYTAFDMCHSSSFTNLTIIHRNLHLSSNIYFMADYKLFQEFIFNIIVKYIYN